MYGWLFILGLSVSLALMPVARALAWRFNMLDQPDVRKVHRKPTPLLGGLAIYGGFCAAIAVLARHDRLFLLFLLCSTYLLLVGLIDDRLDLHARQRLAMQAIAAVVLAICGVRFSFGMGTTLAIVVTVIWLLGLINSINCLDCIDGAAGTYAATACVWFFILALDGGRLGVASLAAALAGAVIGFLHRNYPPASIFMGDLGSTFLGLMLGILSITSGQPASDFFRFPVEALVVVPIAYDFILVHVRRYRGGIRNVRDLLSSTGKDHLPHRLLAACLTPREADLILALLASLWAMTALLLRTGSFVPALFSGAVAVGALLFGEQFLQRLTRTRQSVPMPQADPEMAAPVPTGGK